jgi:hypothetical protein
MRLVAHGDDSVVSLTLLCYWFDIIETRENHYALERRHLHHLTKHQLYHTNQILVEEILFCTDMPRWCTLTTAINHTGLYHCQILDELLAYWWHKNLLKCYKASAFGYPTSPQQLIRIMNTTKKWDTDTTYFASTCPSHVIMSKTYRT